MRQLKKEQQKAKANSETAPHNLHKLANLWLQKCLYAFILQVLEEMSKVVDIPSIMERIITEYTGDSLVEIKHFILKLLDSHVYVPFINYNSLLSDATPFYLERQMHSFQKTLFLLVKNCTDCYLLQTQRHKRSVPLVIQNLESLQETVTIRVLFCLDAVMYSTMTA